MIYDVDVKELGLATLEALNQAGLSFHGIQTPNGFQFVFKNNQEKQYVKALNNLGFLYDTRVAGKGYVVYPTVSTGGRTWVKKSDKPLDVSPYWLECRSDKKKFAADKAETIGLPFQMGERDDSFTRYVGSIGHIQNLSIEQKNQMIEIVANWFCTPVFEKYRKFFNHQYLHSGATEARESVPSGFEFLTEKGKFLHHLFAQMLINNHHVKVIVDTPYYYDASRGIYTNLLFNRLCAEYAPNIHEKEYKEVMFISL